MNLKKMIGLAILGLLTCPIYATTILLETECVGYYNISLPENIETALYQGNEVANKIKEQKIKFSDHKIANYSSLIYDDMNLRITTEDEALLQNYMSEAKDITNKLIKKNPENFSYTTSKITGLYNDNAMNLLYIDKRMYNFSNSQYQQFPSNNSDYYKNTFFHLVNNFRPRKLFELPPQKGFCIPYGYIANSSERLNSKMGVTYRLIEHPDITVFFKVSNSEYISNPDYWKGSAKDRVKEFWDSTYDNDVKEHHLLGFPRYKSIKIDGRNGKGAFVEIRYKDGRASDYGYYSLVPLVAEADKDTPELSMYVIGKASESMGKIPLTKDEIYDLAKAIEASIQRRVFN